MTVDMAALSGYWTAAARVAAVLVLGFGILRLGDSVIGRLSQSVSKGRNLRIMDNRGRTMASLLKSLLRYAVGTVLLLTVLDLAGIDTRALLGGAAVLGVAVGFGAQNLVRDIITGFFIIYERQYDIGDYVSTAGVSGTVEEIGLRTTRLRDWNGDVHVIPNSLIERTTNSSKADSRVLVSVTLAHGTDVRAAMDAMRSVCDEVRGKLPVITEGPTVLGVSELGLTGIVVQVWGRTKPLEHWAVERELRLRLKEALDSAGISLAQVSVPSGGPPGAAK